LNCDRNE
jgi:hypothetical protein